MNRLLDKISIKYKGANTAAVETAGSWKILRMTASCFRYAPKQSFQALFALTDMVYEIEGVIQGDIEPKIKDNGYGITYEGNSDLAIFLQNYKILISNTAFKYFRHLGVSILIMLISILAKSNLKKFADWRKIFICLSIFSYDFGTMLLLTGPDSRFFYITYLVCPLIIIMMFKNAKTESLL